MAAKKDDGRCKKCGACPECGHAAPQFIAYPVYVPTTAPYNPYGPQPYSAPFQKPTYTCQLTTANTNYVHGNTFTSSGGIQ